jgi:hypothetical protein
MYSSSGSFEIDCFFPLLFLFIGVLRGGLFIFGLGAWREGYLRIVTSNVTLGNSF